MKPTYTKEDMTALSDTAYYTRRTINWTILTVIGYIILRIFWGIGVVLWTIAFPPKAPPPNHAFGTLPAIKFPAQATPSAQLTYTLETISGGLPNASSSANVYFMPKTAPNLLGLNVAQEDATSMQFDNNPIQESKNVYRFSDVAEPLRRLRYDIVSRNFILRYAFEQDSSAFVVHNLPNTEAAKTEVINMLNSFDRLPADYKNGPVQVTFLKLMNNQLVTTTSLSQADAVRVDFFRKPIGPAKMVTPNPTEGPISVILSGNTLYKKRVLQFAYTYWPVDYLTTATYPLISSTTAWNQLQSGNGFIARYPTGVANIIIRDVYLAYYDSIDPQTYLQPIFVFEGDNGFVGYVPAVSADWTEQR